MERTDPASWTRGQPRLVPAHPARSAVIVIRKTKIVIPSRQRKNTWYSEEKKLYGTLRYRYLHNQAANSIVLHKKKACRPQTLLGSLPTLHDACYPTFTSPDSG